MIPTQCEQLHPDWERLSTLAWSETMHKLPSSSEMCTHVVVWSYTYVYSHFALVKFVLFTPNSPKRIEIGIVIQLWRNSWTAFLITIIYSYINEYETDPHFLHTSQHLTSGCLLISVFFPVLTCFEQKNCFKDQNKTIFCSKQVRMGKNTEINKQSDVNCQVLV